jgi:hypothetical protein
VYSPAIEPENADPVRKNLCPCKGKWNSSRFLTSLISIGFHNFILGKNIIDLFMIRDNSATKEFVLEEYGLISVSESYSQP